MKNKLAVISHNFEITQENNLTGWNMPFTHYHNHYEIYILETGNRTVQINEMTYPIAPLDATLFSPNILHQSLGQVPYQGICIQFSQSFLNQYFTPEAISVLLACFNHPVIHLTPTTFSEIKKIAVSFDCNLPDNFTLFTMIMKMINSCTNTGYDYNIVESAPILKSNQVIRYIDDNYITIRTLNDIATSLNISESYIYALTNEKFHMTPKQYINHLRIQHAIRYLQVPSVSIHQIAVFCGYSSYEYFVRVFKKEMNCTPEQYRKSL